jgi:2-amino-4-hydroxy-6-hydroxymethyldihydropteridine diphosphokinase
VALALGGNLPGAFSGPAGSSAEPALVWALRQLASSLGPLRVASLYRSRPVSAVPQPDYLNTAAVGSTALPPDAVLALAKALELAAGRRRGVRFGPRPLDVDLLVYGDLRLDTPELTLPHPRLRERRFVLAPLAEVAPDLPVPPDGTGAAELLARLGPAVAADAVERRDWKSPP